jgi:hypothetical protein
VARPQQDTSREVSSETLVRTLKDEEQETINSGRRSAMIHSRYRNLLVAGMMLVGCAKTPEPSFVSISDGLPEGQQWKCSPAFGDVNGDGLLDLAAIPRKGKGACVWINRLQGPWVESSDGLSMESSTGGGIDFGDLNKDGYLDMVVADHSRGIFVYCGHGNGTWTPLSEIPIAMQSDDVALGDIDGDGDLDICACSSTDEGIGIFLADGKGAWERARDLGFPDSDCCREIVLRDFNHDEIPDLAATMTPRPCIWLSDGNGKWVESSSGIPETPWGGQYWGLAAGDVNEDEHPDLVVARIVGGPEVFLGDGQGVWIPSSAGLSAIQSSWGVALADFNADGHMDLAASGKKNKDDRGNAYGVFVFLGDGGDRWRLGTGSGLPQDGLYQSWGLASADLDGDGTMEIMGCFGIGFSEEPLPMFISDDQPQEIEGREWGPGGSVRVWKIMRAE